MNIFRWPFLLALTWLIAPPARGAEEDLYNFLWLDPDKKVYVLQNKIYPKKHTVYLNFGYLSGLSSTYQNVRGGKAALGFYVFEEWALELFYHQYHNGNNRAYDELKSISQTVTPIRRFDNKMGGFILYSPFYGKINTFNQIIYFDLSFGIGSGLLKGESNFDSVGKEVVKERYEQESFPAVHLKTDLRIYSNKYMHIGLEFHHSLYQGSYATEDGMSIEKITSSTSEISILIGFSI